MKLEELIKQDRFSAPGQKALLNVLATGSWINAQLAGTMGRYGLTPAQYNVLRILRGSDPVRLTCSEIGSRLLDRTPDVTRLLNRLEAAGLVDRNRSASDRRVVEVGITSQGVDVLSAMNPEVDAIRTRMTRHLSESDLEQLSDLLERFRADQLG